MEKTAPATQATSGGTDQDGSERTSVKGLLRKFAEGTSMHGLGRVVSTRSLWLRLLWASLVLTGAGVAAYNVIKIILLFFDYPVSTVVSLEYASKIQFPAITICNLNLLKKSQLEQNIQLQFLRDADEGQSGSSTQTPNNDTSEFDYDDFDPEASAEEEYKIRFFLANVERRQRYLFGHTLEDMLIQCSYHDAKCSADTNFTEFYNQKYGNCYTFNKDVTADSVSKSGPVHGVKLHLNAETDEYSQITDSVGFKLVIHPPDQMPFPEDEGVLVSPGFSTSIAVSKLDIKRAEAPYGRCVNYGRNDHKHLNMYTDLFGVGYSDKACHRTCFQGAMVDNCGCCHRDFPCFITTVDDLLVNVSFCNYTNREIDDCSAQIESRFEADTLGCADICLPACYETTYNSEVSTARWPSPSREDITVKFLSLHNSTTGKEVDIDYVRTNIAQVVIYFKELNYEKIETSPAYDWSRLVSDLGGQFGLWLGFSLLTAVEICQLIFDICHHLGSRVCCGTRRTSPKNSKVEISQGN